MFYFLKMKRTPQARSSEQTTSPSQIIKKLFYNKKMKYATGQLQITPCSNINIHWLVRRTTLPGRALLILLSL